MGVSMLLLLLLLVLPPLLDGWLFDAGGGGRAKGLGGPWAPALSKADAEGDGGGRTTVEWLASAGLLVVGGPLGPVEVDAAAAAPPPPPPPTPGAGLVPVAGEDPAVILPASDVSLGI